MSFKKKKKSATAHTVPWWNEQSLLSMSFLFQKKKKKDTTEFLEVLKNQSWWFSGMEIKTGRGKESEIQNVCATPIPVQ